ncbi:MAG: PAS domain S-box protein [Deltaproteobacteria bacterium]|jgi:PAS domain S-box-containing protein|nr:PAS domain S-box protein [Deltaproteobacteria bacterium]
MLLDPRVVLAVFCAYIAFLFFIALWVERQAEKGKSPANNPFVYSLSLAVYCTAWTYYGSVGQAATSGLLFLPMYAGPTVAVFLWWSVLRKLVRLKNSHKITSIADFISARYNKSQSIAALVTLISIVGITPYIALQLKAIFSTFAIITMPPLGFPPTESLVTQWVCRHMGPVVVVLLIFFTIILGVRHLDPTERHEGMVMALAVECVVKLIALLAAGLFVTYWVYDGFGDIFSRLSESRFRDILTFGGKGSSYFTWTSYFILSMSAVTFLPRQFHVAVVENHNEKHILTAMWVLPLYLLLVSIFVVPIAVGGLLEGHPIEQADTFVLRLPLYHGTPWLSLFVFLGGFSASVGMVMISSVTMATMITNHLMHPVIELRPQLAFLKRHLLKCRWAGVALFILMGYGFEEYVGETYMLVNIGLISFTAILQFAPSILGGIFWRRGNRHGAQWGLTAGFLVWFYTLLVPSYVRSGWLPQSILDHGPFGLEFLRPEHLLGLSGVNPFGNAVFWTMLVNIGIYIFGSLYGKEDEAERTIAEEFVGTLDILRPIRRARPRDAYIELEPKAQEIRRLLSLYFTDVETGIILQKCLQDVGIEDGKFISIVQLLDLHSMVEKSLAGAIGAASAHRVLRQGTIFSPREARELAEVYGEILAQLKVTPGELATKIDYYQEKEILLTQQARELEGKVHELEYEISMRKKTQEALRESEERYRRLVESMNEGLQIEDESGIITYVNDKLCQMWGMPREEIIGRRAEEFIYESPAEPLKAKMLKRREGEIQSFEMSWVTRERRRIHAVVSSVPILTPDGCYRGSFTVITDISHLKALEREKANIISMFAHDMRSSLSGIHGLGLRLLKHSQAMDEEKRVEYLRIINREAAKLEALVDDFLDFSRLETGRLKMQFRSTSLDKELVELFEIYQEKAQQKDMCIHLRIDQALPIIEADVNRLRRVFTNLLDNALKFSREKGNITVMAEESKHEVVIKVIDEGVGIEMAELPYIFDLFHRGPGGERKEGYGIGLATVKAIVEGHGGRVQVESKVGEGSVFTVHLPTKRKGTED